MTAAAGEGGTAEQGGTGPQNDITTENTPPTPAFTPFGPSTGGESESESGFAPITSQDELDHLMGKRLAQKEKAVRAEFKGFDDYKAKAQQFDQLKAETQTDAERDSALQTERDAALQTAKDAADRADKAELALLQQNVAITEGLPLKFAAKLSGTTEEELRADAQDTFGDFINKTPSFDHGARSQSAPQTMNDLIFGARRGR